MGWASRPLVNASFTSHHQTGSVKVVSFTCHVMITAWAQVGVLVPTVTCTDTRMAFADAAPEVCRGAFFLFWNMVPLVGKPILCGMIPEPACEHLESKTGMWRLWVRIAFGLWRLAAPPLPLVHTARVCSALLGIVQSAQCRQPIRRSCIILALQTR